MSLKKKRNGKIDQDEVKSLVLQYSITISQLKIIYTLINEHNQIFLIREILIARVISQHAFVILSKNLSSKIVSLVYKFIQIAQQPCSHMSILNYYK